MIPEMRVGEYAEFFDKGVHVGTIYRWKLNYEHQDSWTADAYAPTSDVLTVDEINGKTFTFYFLPDSDKMKRYMATGVAVIDFDVDTMKCHLRGIEPLHGSLRSEYPRVEWMTVQDITETLQVHEETVRRWIRDGKLKAILLGSSKGGYRIQRSDFNAFLAEMGKAAA